jgi:hypothetical protein
MHGFTPLFARLEWITLSHNMGTRTTQEGPPESVLARSFPLSPHPRQKRPGVLSTAGTKIIDVVAPEPEGGAHLNPDAAANELKSHLLAALREVRTVSPRRLLAIRYERYRHIGRVGVHWRGLVRSAIGNAFGVVAGLLRGTALRQGSTQALNPMKPVRTGDS